MEDNANSIPNTPELLNETTPCYFKAGERDPGGFIIKDIYTIQAESNLRILYVIYSIQDGNQLRYFINPNNIQEYIPNEDKMQINVNKLEPELSVIKARLPIVKQNTIYIMVAKAIHICFRGDNDENTALAKKVLEKADYLINYYIQTWGKIEYLGGCLIIFLLTLLLYFFSSYQCLEIDSNFFCLMKQKLIQNSFYIFSEVIFYGSLGAYLSVAINSKKLVFEPDSPTIMNVIAGSLRIIIGILSGVVILLAIKSQILLGNLSLLNETDTTNISIWFIRFLAVISGFSETFIPDIIERMTTQEIKNNESKSV